MGGPVMSDEPVMATTWEQCAQHVEKGGMVEVQLSGGEWCNDLLSVSVYRRSPDRPGEDDWRPRRLLPLPR